MTPKNPESLPIIRRMDGQLQQVDIARATGKLTPQQAIDIANKINDVHHQLAAYFTANRKNNGASNLSSSQITKLNDMLDKTAKLIPKRQK